MENKVVPFDMVKPKKPFLRAIHEKAFAVKGDYERKTRPLDNVSLVCFQFGKRLTIFISYGDKRKSVSAEGNEWAKRRVSV